jgi:hypothetical protein
MQKKIIEIEQDCMTALKVLKQTEGQSHAFQIAKLLRAHARQIKARYPILWKELNK